MIRFQGLRPRFLPKWLGLGSENAAQRIAAEWEQEGGPREGIFIPRRDTNSRFNKILGGRVFPGNFPSLSEAAGFFSLGATGYSATNSEGYYHGMELRRLTWTVAPMAIEKAQSCFFDDRERFPSGTAMPDCALLMRDISHEWHSRPGLRPSPSGESLTTVA